MFGLQFHAELHTENAVTLGLAATLNTELVLLVP